MAITIITQPISITPAYNPIIITASSTNTAQPNFRFVVDIVITYPLSVTKRIKISPRPDGFLLFDAHRIIENYLSYDFTLGDATDSIECLNSDVVYSIQLREEYGIPPSVSGVLANTGSIKAINAAVKHSLSSFGNETDFINLDIPTQYQMLNGTTSTTRKFLTTAPGTGIKICSDNNYYLYITTATANQPLKLQLKTYDDGGSLLGTSYKSLTAYATLVQRYGVGTKNINLWNAALLVGAASYKITLVNGSNVALGETLTFNIDCDCSKFNEKFRLHWLNPLGGFDAYSFNMRFDRTFNSVKSSFKKILGAVDAAGAFTFAPSQAGKTQFNILTSEKIKVHSNWITEDESNWLFTLSKSTQVFWEIDSDTYAPVIVTNTAYAQKTYAGNNLFNIDFEIEIGNDIISQRQ